MLDARFQVEDMFSRLLAEAPPHREWDPLARLGYLPQEPAIIHWQCWSLRVLADAGVEYPAHGFPDEKKGAAAETCRSAQMRHPKGTGASSNAATRRMLGGRVRTDPDPDDPGRNS